MPLWERSALVAVTSHPLYRLSHLSAEKNHLKGSAISSLPYFFSHSVFLGISSMKLPAWFCCVGVFFVFLFFLVTTAVTAPGKAKKASKNSFEASPEADKYVDMAYLCVIHSTDFLLFVLLPLEQSSTRGSLPLQSNIAFFSPSCPETRGSLVCT